MPIEIIRDRSQRPGKDFFKTLKDLSASVRNEEELSRFIGEPVDCDTKTLWVHLGTLLHPSVTAHSMMTKHRGSATTPLEEAIHSLGREICKLATRDRSEGEPIRNEKEILVKFLECEEITRSEVSSIVERIAIRKLTNQGR
ncbi:MAG: hypothetical protein ACXAEN_18785 [Candidatus Thorarchaeota archaeon]|jgi:hypothetical protein